MTAFSIVIPVHNEADNLLPLLKEINRAVTQHQDVEIICVDDCSTDNTAEVLHQTAQKMPHLQIIRLAECSGQSAGVLAGVQAARHPIIVTMDGDGQNDPADIDNLLRHFLAHGGSGNNRLVIGQRSRRQDSAWRKFSSKLANAVRNLCLGDSTPDSGCGIKVFHKEAFLELPRFNHMHRFLPILFRFQGGPVFSLSVNHRPRLNGQSHYGTLDRMTAGLLDLLGVLWLGKRTLAPKPQEIGSAHE